LKPLALVSCVAAGGLALSPSPAAAWCYGDCDYDNGGAALGFGMAGLALGVMAGAAAAQAAHKRAYATSKQTEIGTTDRDHRAALIAATPWHDVFHQRSLRIDPGRADRHGGGGIIARPAHDGRASVARQRDRKAFLNHVPHRTRAAAQRGALLRPSPYSLIIAAPIFLSGSPVSAANHYVDNALSTSGTGTSWSSAWNSFSKIVWSNIRPGDTIYISGGASFQTYFETLTVGASGSSTGMITITKGIDAGHDGTVIIDGQNTLPNGVYLYGHNYVDVRNLFVRNISDAAIVVKYATADVIIDYNTTYSGDPGGGNARGIDVRNNIGTDALLVLNNTVTTATDTTAQTDGIYTSGNTGVIIDHNVVVISNSDTTGHSDGIQSYKDTNVIIRNNWVEQANYAPYNNHGMWLTDTLTGGTLQVYNNVVYVPNLTQDSALTHYNDSGYTGVAYIWNNTIYGGARGVNIDASNVVKNNIIWPSANGFGVVMTGSTPPAANINNNLIWAPNANIANIDNITKTWSGWQAFGYDSKGVNADPGFTNLSYKQLMPTPTSAALNAGTPISQVTTDLQGVPRPQGSAYSIGAFEYIPGGP
jgi:hypothetical protein